MKSPNPTPIKSTTQEHLDILDITQNVVLLKEGSVALVLQVSAVNFDLLSLEEQEAIIYAYAGLLNSLTFPIQIIVKSQKKDVSNYLKLLEDQERKSTSLTRKDQIKSYRQFIRRIVKDGNVLDKKFYCIVSFSRIELGLKAASPLSLKKAETLPYDKSYILQKAITALNPKKDHLIRQFAGVGLTARALGTSELIQLFYNAYNPDQAKEKNISQGGGFDVPMVQAKLTTKPPEKIDQPTTLANQEVSLPTAQPSDKLSDQPISQPATQPTSQPVNALPTNQPLMQTAVIEEHPAEPVI